MTDPQPTSGALEAAAGRPVPEPAPAAHPEADAIRLGRFMPLGLAAGAALGLVAGALTHRFGICVPAGTALGVFLAATLPVFRARR